MNRNQVKRISFAAVQTAWGKNREAEILLSLAKPELKVAVRHSLDDRGAWPGAAVRQSRKRPFD